MSLAKKTYPFTLPELPYDYNALEPFIDTETMYIHHDKHFGAYVQNLNKALEPCPRLHRMTLEELLSNPRSIPEEHRTAVMRNAGGTYNHDFFFNHLSASCGSPKLPDENILRAIERAFGSYDHFKEAFTKEAAGVFGSGYAMLALDSRGCAVIKTLANQDAAPCFCLTPILLLDVWEHAYYLKYKNVRADYITAAWNILCFANGE